MLVVVGTDKHPFDRLMDWLQRWYAHRADQPRLLIQHGSSRRPELPGAVEFLGHRELTAAMAAATLVVTHGGPATITEARRTGHLPIVVPRDPRLGEHIDDHQQLFVRRLAQDRMVDLCATATELAGALDAGLADPGTYQLAADPVDGDARLRAVAQVGRIVEELVRGRGPGAVTGRRR